MKRITFLFMMSMMVLFAQAQRISNLTIDGYTALTPFGAFNPSGGNPGDGQIVYANDVDLSNVNVTLTAGSSVIEPDPLPTDWSSTVTGIVVTEGSKSATYDITIKKINPTPLPFEILTGAGNFDSNSWTSETVGWAGAAIDKNQNNIRFGSVGRSFVIAFENEPDSLYHILKYLTTPFPTDGSVVFDVDESSDGLTWTSVCQYNATRAMPLSADPNVKEGFKLSQGCRYVRWTYTKRDKANVALNYLLVTKDMGVSVDAVHKNTKITYHNGVLNFNDIDGIAQVEIYDITGTKRFQTQSISKSMDVSSLQSGVFVGKITYADDVVRTVKFVK